MTYTILNLDGTISDDKWREKFINLKETGQYRYHDYQCLAGFDMVCNEQLFRASANELIIITSRPMLYQVITMQWLFTHNIPVKYIGLAPSRYTGSGSDLKNGLLTSLMLQHSIDLKDIEVVYESHPDVCTMYRKMGLQAIEVLNRRKDDEMSKV